MKDKKIKLHHSKNIIPLQRRQSTKNYPNLRKVKLFFSLFSNKKTQQKLPITIEIILKKFRAAIFQNIWRMLSSL
jgi:hypothetical protein